MLKKTSNYVFQWILFMVLFSPTWAWNFLPDCVTKPILLGWGQMSGFTKTAIIAALSGSLITMISAFVKKIRANHIRPWSKDGKNDTPDINIKSPANGDRYIQVYGRVIKANLFLTPISYIFDPFFRLVTKFYFESSGNLSEPTPKTMSFLRDDDKNCDHLDASMQITKKAKDRLLKVEKLENEKEVKDADLLEAINCIKQNIILEPQAKKIN